MNQQYTENRFVVSSWKVTFTLAFTLISSGISVTNTCNGTVDFSILYNDGQIKSVRVDGMAAPIDTETSTPTSPLGLPIFNQHDTFAGENGMTIENGYRFQFIPGGRSGSYVVNLFDYETKVWSTVDVYCQPLGLTYRRDYDEVVGFCAVNVTYGPLACVPYFKLRIQDAQWVDVSRRGSCSQPLATINITNAVILQSDSDYETDETRLYFAEHGTNRLHEVSLSAGEARYYETDPTLKIDHLIPVNNASILGIRVVCHRVYNSSDFYHKLFLWHLDSTQQQQTGFIGGVVQTESVAFDSYHLDYLVTFNANRNTVIIYKDRQSQYYKNLPTLDYPLQCQNLAEPSAHYLICVAGNGHLPLLINLTGDTVTNKSIGSDESKKVIRAGVLAKNTFYLLNDHEELSIYLLTATIMYLETYTVRPNIDFIITTATSDINCSSHNNVVYSNDLNSDESDSNEVAVLIAVATFLVLIIISIIIIIIIACWKRQRIRSYFLNVKKKASGNITLNDETVSSLNVTIAQPASDYPVNSERGAEINQCDVSVQQTIAQQETVNSVGHGSAVNGMNVNYAYMPSSLPMERDLSENSTDPWESQLEYADAQSVSPIQSTDDNLSMPKLVLLRPDPDGKR